MLVRCAAQIGNQKVNWRKMVCFLIGHATLKPVISQLDKVYCPRCKLVFADPKTSWLDER